MRNQYVDYLNEYWNSGEVSNIDSALRYNELLLKSETDSVIAIDYLYRIQMLSICGRYDSILSFVNRIPNDILSWPPDYKSYLRLKCKAIKSNSVGDTSQYYFFLDSIMLLWEPLMSDSLTKTDSLFSLSFDSVAEKYGHLIFAYINYYEIKKFLYGKNLIDQILSYKKEEFKWNIDTYIEIRELLLGDSEITLP